MVKAQAAIRYGQGHYMLPNPLRDAIIAASHIAKPIRRQDDVCSPRALPQGLTLAQGFPGGDPPDE